MKQIIPPASLAVGCLALLAPAVLAQDPPLPAGILRGHAIASTGPAAPAHRAVAVGDYSGDLRMDAAVVTSEGLSFVIGTAGYGFSALEPTPEAGIAMDCEHFPAGNGAPESVLWLVDQGAQPGLHLAHVTPAGGISDTYMPGASFTNCMDIEVQADPTGHLVYGLSTDGLYVLVAKHSELGFFALPRFGLGSAMDSIELGPWGANSVPHIFAAAGNSIRIYSQAGVLVQTITTVDNVHDYDVHFSANRGHARLAVITVDQAGVYSWLELHDADGSSEGPQSLGLTLPRVQLAAMAGTSMLDFTAVSSDSAVGYTAVAGLGVGGQTFDFGKGLYPWFFPSLDYPNVGHDANISVGDFDNDGDLDVLCTDEATGAVWMQPNTLNSEVSLAPTAIVLEGEYAEPGSTPNENQHLKLSVSYAMQQGFVPTHVQVTAYQKTPTGTNQFVYIYRGGVTADYIPQGQASHFQVSFEVDDSDYEGEDGTTARLVFGVRYLRVNTAGTSFEEVGPESFSKETHRRLWIPVDASGYYMEDEGIYDLAGGVNPLPTTRGDDRDPITPPPPAPTPTPAGGGV